MTSRPSTISTTSGLPSSGLSGPGGFASQSSLSAQAPSTSATAQKPSRSAAARLVSEALASHTTSSGQAFVKSAGSPQPAGGAAGSLYKVGPAAISMPG